MQTEAPYTVVYRYATDAMPRDARFESKEDAELFLSVLRPLHEQGKIVRARLWVRGGPCLQELN